MSTIVDDITTVLTSKTDELVNSALALKANDPSRPSIFKLINWNNESGPVGFEEMVQVSTNASAGTFAKGGAYNAAGAGEEVPGVWGYSRYHFTIEATKTQLAQLEAARRMGQEKIGGFLQRRIEEGAAAALNVMENDLINNTASIDPNGFNGLEYVASASNTYGGISATTYSNTGSIRTAVGAALTLAAMDTIANTFYSTNQGNYDVILTSMAARQKYEDLVAGATNMIPAPYSVTSTDMTGAERAFIAGYTSHWYRGKPLFALDGCPTDSMFFLDSSALQGMRLRPWEIQEFSQIEADRVRWVATTELAFYVRNRRKSLAMLDTLTP